MQSDKTALQRAKVALNQAKYLAEFGRNAGIRKIYSDRAKWLWVLIFFAEIGMEKDGEKT